MWVGVSERLLRIDPGSGKQLAAIPIGVDRALRLEPVRSGSPPVVTTRTRARPPSRGSTREQPCRGDHARGVSVRVAADDSGVWVAGSPAVGSAPGSAYAMRIDPATNRKVAEVDLPPGSNMAEVAIGAGAVWVAYYGFP